MLLVSSSGQQCPPSEAGHTPDRCQADMGIACLALRPLQRTCLASRIIGVFSLQRHVQFSTAAVTKFGFKVVGKSAKLLLSERGLVPIQDSFCFSNCQCTSLLQCCGRESKVQLYG